MTQTFLDEMAEAVKWCKREASRAGGIHETTRNAGLSAIYYNRSHKLNSVAYLAEIGLKVLQEEQMESERTSQKDMAVGSERDTE